MFPSLSSSISSFSSEKRRLRLFAGNGVDAQRLGIVGWGQVADAQVAVLDEAIDALEQTVAARPDADQWTWC